jgi:hypothetical protein
MIVKDIYSLFISTVVTFSQKFSKIKLAVCVTLIKYEKYLGSVDISRVDRVPETNIYFGISEQINHLICIYACV